MDSNRFSYRFTLSAERDLDGILKYIYTDLDNPSAAKKLGEKIFHKINLIRDFPDSGSVVDNEFLKDKTVRKISADNYLIFYTSDNKEKMINIVRIIYSKRDLDEILKTI